MNKHITLIANILLTLLVAGLLSMVIAVILTFVLANVGVSNLDSLSIGSAVSYVVFGALFGYRLNDLIKVYKLAK